jgi:hypothetical protein
MLFDLDERNCSESAEDSVSTEDFGEKEEDGCDRGI